MRFRALAKSRSLLVYICKPPSGLHLKMPEQRIATTVRHLKGFTKRESDEQDHNSWWEVWVENGMDVLRTPGTSTWLRTPGISDQLWEMLEKGKGRSDDLKSEFQGLFTPTLPAFGNERSPDLSFGDLQEVPRFGADQRTPNFDMKMASPVAAPMFQSTPMFPLQSETTKAVSSPPAPSAPEPKPKSQIQGATVPSARQAQEAAKRDIARDEFLRLHKKKLREAAILRLRQKREERKYSVKQVRYACRKKIADSRPRVKGRFVRKTETAVSPASEPLSFLNIQN